MADSISISFHDGDMLDALAGIKKGADRATMYALRAAGRTVVATSRSAAPIYRGPRSNFTGGNPKNVVVPGRLRDSIKASRNIDHVGPMYSLKVGPSGFPAYLYAAKEEALQPYMRPGAVAAEASFGLEMEKAIAKVIWKHETGGGKATF